MNVCIFTVYKPGDHKDFNGGYGTTFDVGKSLPSKVLMKIRSNFEYLPVLTHGYLAALLKDNVENLNLKYYENEIPEKMDYVFLHASLIRHNEEIKKLQEYKAKYPEAKTIIYGPLATSIAKDYEGKVDIIFKADIENLFNKFNSLDEIPLGITDLGQIDSLESLPFPDWSPFPYKKFKQYPIMKKNPIFMVLGSKSCPYKCNYCPYISNDSQYRFRSAPHVIEELVYLKKNFGARSILFRDPVFSMKKKWVLDLCNMMIDQKLDLEWTCETRLDRMDEELVDKMAEAGMTSIKVGVESFNHELLKKYDRVPPQKDRQERLIKYMEDKGVQVVAFYVIGLPDDTHSSVNETIEYSKELNTSYANFTICTPIPGTGFYETVKDKINDHNLEHYNNFNPVFETNHLTKDDIVKYKEQAISSYYFRFKYLSKQMRNFISLR